MHFASEYKLIEYEVSLLKVEDDVQLADIAIVFVHLFDVAMHNLKGNQFVVGGGAASNEEKRSVSAVDHFGVWRVVIVSANVCLDEDVQDQGRRVATFVFKKIAHSSASGKDKLRNIFDDLGLLLGRKGNEPFG